MFSHLHPRLLSLLLYFRHSDTKSWWSKPFSWNVSKYKIPTLVGEQDIFASMACLHLHTYLTHASHSCPFALQGPAPDGETFFVTALLYASARWGDGGAFNYSQWANTVLGLVTGKPNPQQMFDPTSKLVRFDPGSTFTDPSCVTMYRLLTRPACVSVLTPS